MKKCVVGIMGVFLFLAGFSSNAQQTDSFVATIQPYIIAVSYYKTTNLIFPYAIKSVDRGSGDVLVQKAKGVDNILQLKAGKENFEQTNLSLVTADGKFYSFLLDFAAQPAVLNISFDKESIALVSGQTNEEILEKEAGRVVEQSQFLGVRKNDQLLRFSLHGIYLSTHAMWLKLQLRNYSQIDFDPDYIRFFLRDRRRSKRTAIQEKEIFPIYTNAKDAIKGSSAQTWLFAFQPFTVPRHQRLIIETNDKTGGRRIELRIKNKLILRTKKLH